MVKKMKLLVLMAGRYDIVKGAKIRFYLDADKNLYIASCERKDFGIVKFVKEGSKKDLQMLGAEFDGVVPHTDSDQYLMEVLVKAQKRAA